MTSKGNNSPREIVPAGAAPPPRGCRRSPHQLHVYFSSKFDEREYRCTEYKRSTEKLETCKRNLFRRPILQNLLEMLLYATVCRRPNGDAAG